MRASSAWTYIRPSCIRRSRRAAGGRPRRSAPAAETGGAGVAASASGPTGGAAAPDPPPLTTPLPTAQLSRDGRTAIPPAAAPQPVKDAIYAANRIVGKPYRYGGGHRRFNDTRLRLLRQRQLRAARRRPLKRPLHSSAFMSWGEAGKGQWITVYTNPGHAYVVIAGLRFDTSGPGQRGPRWRKTARVEPRVHRAPPRGLLAPLAPDRRLEPSQRRRGHDDLVAVLQPDARLAPAADPRGSPGGDDVAGLQRHQAGEVRHERRHREDQVARCRPPASSRRSGSARTRSRRVAPASSGVTSAGPHGAEPSNTLPGIHCGVANWRSRAERSLSSVYPATCSSASCSSTSRARRPITNATSAS